MIVLIGNPSPHSRTSRVAAAVADRLAAAVADDDVRTIELADHAGRLFDPDDAELVRLTADVAAAAILVVASPTYKATYTGLLKSFLDRYGTDGLAGVTAIPVMTGNAPQHAMGVEVHLRPLLVELGASVPLGGLYFPMGSYDKLDDVVDAWAARQLGATRLDRPL